MILVFIAIFGLCLGSFVNALVWRLHEQALLEAGKGKKAEVAVKSRELSITRGRSMCPHCKHQLKALDLLPVVSWLSLKGKCRYCHKPISRQYPVVEALVALLFVASYIWWPLAWNAAGWVQFGLWLLMVVGFVALVIYDLRWMLLPNKIIFGLAGLVLLQTVVRAVAEGLWWQPLLGAVWGFLVLGGLFWVLFQLSNGRWIGGGDVKLGFVLGVLVGGPTHSLLLLLLASTIGSAISVGLLLSGKATRSTRIPFGPFLLLAAFITVLFGASILQAYKQLFTY